MIRPTVKNKYTFLCLKKTKFCSGTTSPKLELYIGISISGVAVQHKKGEIANGVSYGSV